MKNEKLKSGSNDFFISNSSFFISINRDYEKINNYHNNSRATISHRL